MQSDTPGSGQTDAPSPDADLDSDTAAEQDARYAARTDQLKARIAQLAEGPDEAEAPVQGETSPRPGGSGSESSKADAPLLAAIRQAVQEAIARSIPGAVSAAVQAALAPGLEDAAALEPRLAALEDALDGVGDRLEALARDGAALMSSTLDALTEQVAGLGGAPVVTRAPADEPLLALRSDIADALEYVRDELFTRTEQGFESLRQALAGSPAPVDPQPAAAAPQLGQAERDAASISAAREQLEWGAEAQRADLSALADGVRDDVEAALGQLQQQLATLSRGVREGLAEGLTRLEERAAALTEQGQAIALEPLVTSTRDAVAGVLADVRAAAVGQREQVAGLRGDVQLVADRLLGAGRALVEHLAGRDLQLERARDELTGRLLADVLETVPVQEREAAIRRATGLLQRRRESRDAARWRAGVPAQPTLPEGVADEDELLRMIDAGRSPSAAPPRAAPVDRPPPVRGVDRPPTAKGAVRAAGASPSPAAQPAPAKAQPPNPAKAPPAAAANAAPAALPNAAPALPTAAPATRPNVAPPARPNVAPAARVPPAPGLPAKVPPTAPAKARPRPTPVKASSPVQASTKTPPRPAAARPRPGRAADPAPGRAADPAPGRAADPAPGGAADTAGGNAAKPAPGNSADPAPGRAPNPVPKSAEPAPGPAPEARPTPRPTPGTGARPTPRPTPGPTPGRRPRP